MKNSKALVVLVLALLAGLVAVVLAARWMTARTTSGSQIAVAVRELELGTVLDAASMTTVTWSGPSLPEGAVADPQALPGRVLRTTLARGEPILESRLAPVGSRGGLSAAIAAGKRAITVRVNEVVGVAGFALPGSLVDVMVHTTVDDTRRGQGAPVSKIVLERILVLAVAQEASRDETRPKVANAVTLEVTPEQAELLDVARSVGHLSLVLRNPVDRTNVGTAGMGKADLFASAPAAAVRLASIAAPPAAHAPPRRLQAPPAERPARPPSTALAASTNPVSAPTGAPRADAAAAPAPEPVRVEVIRGVARAAVEL